jgi:hypothetical protein
MKNLTEIAKLENDLERKGIRKLKEALPAKPVLTDVGTNTSMDKVPVKVFHDMGSDPRGVD